MFKGKFFGDVIARIAKDGRNTLVLWCQFDGGCELRLSAMATMVDDEMLCDALGDRETVVLLDQSQREIDAGRDARRSPYVSVPTEDAIRLDPDGWILLLKASGISPVRRRSTAVQQSSPAGKCARADARNAPASARSVNDRPSVTADRSGSIRPPMTMSVSTTASSRTQRRWPCQGCSLRHPHQPQAYGCDKPDFRARYSPPQTRRPDRRGRASGSLAIRKNRSCAWPDRREV